MFAFTHEVDVINSVRYFEDKHLLQDREHSQGYYVGADGLSPSPCMQLQLITIGVRFYQSLIPILFTPTVSEALMQQTREVAFLNILIFVLYAGQQVDLLTHLCTQS